jgi:hypothetical protein
VLNEIFMGLCRIACRCNFLFDSSSWKYLNF